MTTPTDHNAPSGQPYSPPPIWELGPNDPPPPPGTPYHRNFDPNNPPQFPGNPPAHRKRPWIARHKILTGLIAVAALFTVVGVATSAGGGGSTPAAAPSVSVPSMPPLPSEQKDANKSASNAPAPPAAPKLTAGQQNAVRSAKDYLDLSGFSKAGLVNQLVEFEGYSKADATFAVAYLHPNWKAEAVESAKAYLDLSGFSRSGLVTQLTEFDKYTKAEATYAADQVGL